MNLVVENRERPSLELDSVGAVMASISNHPDADSLAMACILNPSVRCRISHTTRLSSKGRITIPKVVRDARSWKPGLELQVIKADDGILLRPIGSFDASSYDEVEGTPLDYDGPPVPLEHLDGAYALRIRLQRRRVSWDNLSAEHETGT